MASRLSLLAGLVAAGAFVLTDVLLTTSLPRTTYLAGSPHLQTSSDPLRIGGTADPRESFQGRIDEIRVYRRARTPSEIRADMNTPVAATPIAPDLAAAYSFDEESGATLTDLSGHGNDGHIVKAHWTDQGKFGSALDFNGHGSVVVIPHTPSLALTGAMTLEAWIYPTAKQSGWRPILQKEFDAFFLLASSRIGALRPAGGGTFGSSTDIVGASAVAPINAWTHAAVTYDGAVLVLYINGHATARRLRWYPGRIFGASLGDLPIAAGARVESPLLDKGLLSGAPLRVRAVAAVPVITPAPLLALHDVFRNEILLLAAEADDVVFRLRTRAAAAELDSPAVRARGILRDVAAGDDLALVVSRVGRRYCMEVNARSACGLGLTLGMGWTFFAYSQVPPGWPHVALNAGWMGALLFPFGFWLRRRWESLLGMLILAAGIVVPCTIGSLSMSSVEGGAALLGILAGRLCASTFARITRWPDGAVGQQGG